MTDAQKKPEDVRAQLEMSRLLGLSPPLPSWDEIANLLELENLRVGVHYIRDEDRYRVAEFWVPRLWSVEVRPFGQPVWRLAGVRAMGREFRGTKTNDWTKAVLATNEDSAVLALDKDPVADAIGALALMDPWDFSSLDGIWYRLSLQTMALNATLEFSNPLQGSLLTLEREILDLSRSIARGSGKEALISRWHEA
jgi:hypothetical protein